MGLVFSKISRWLLNTIFLLLPAQTALHLWPDWAVLNGTRVDYLSPTLFLIDIFILALLILWFGQIRKDFLKVSIPVILLFGLLLVLSNVLFSFHPLVTSLKFIRLLTYALFGFFAFHNRWEVIASFKKFFLLGIMWLCLLALVQFGLQRHLGGPLYLVGERPLLSAGIARINLGNLGSILRPYGTLPHPNALGGYLVISILILFITRPGGYRLVSLLASVVVWLTFSRTAILSWMFIVWVIIFSKIHISRRALASLILLGTTVSTILLSIFYPKLSSSDQYSQRVILNTQAIEVIKDNILFGTGLGTFPFYSLFGHQPVHNILLLIITELGILTMSFIYSFRINLTQETLLFIGTVLPVVLFDHYWFTLPQNLLLLTIFFIIYRIKYSHETKHLL